MLWVMRTTDTPRPYFSDPNFVAQSLLGSLQPIVGFQAHMKPAEEEDDVLDALGTLANFAR